MAKHTENDMNVLYYRYTLSILLCFCISSFSHDRPSLCCRVILLENILYCMRLLMDKAESNILLTLFNRLKFSYT